MLGYGGKILEVDISEKAFKSRELPENLAKAFIGGRGLGAALLYKELKPGTDPLSKNNPLIFATGPATGTPLPVCARWEAVTKSPLTGTYLCSNAGCFFGTYMKRAGFDVMIIRGKSKNPTWLHVTESGPHFNDAGPLWGKNTEETEASIRRDLKERKLGIVSIGQAGENLVKFATAQNDMLFGARNGSLGRGGIGAVMGAKNLKAVSVIGFQEIEVVDTEGFHNFHHELAADVKTNAKVLNFTNYGTPQFVGPVNEAKLWPTRNFKQGSFEGAEKIDAHAMKEQIVKHNTACYACTVSSGKYSSIDKGPYAGTAVDGPEYETIWSFGADCGVDRLDAISAANKLCDLYGLDTISTGNVIGFAMECFERGLLEMDGIDLKFGNHESFIPMIKKIAFREGVGDLLAEGVREAARKIGRGSEKFAMHVKGMELPAYDPRGAWGMALAYATSCRGGCHLKAWTIGAEILDKKYDRFSTEGKAKLVSDMQNARAVVDSLGVCVFGTRAIGNEEMVKILATVAGWNLNVSDLLRIGERIYSVERAIAVRDGISRKDDTFPQRIFEEPLPEFKDRKFTKRDLDRMLDEYYSIRGWDKDGKPKKEKLKELEVPGLLEGKD